MRIAGTLRRTRGSASPITGLVASSGAVFLHGAGADEVLLVGRRAADTLFVEFSAVALVAGGQPAERYGRDTLYRRPALLPGLRALGGRESGARR